jgi:hypothetical protein
LEGKCGTGTCFEGTCVCEEGYEDGTDGSACSATWAAKFVGTYTGKDVVTASTAGTGLGDYALQPSATVTEVDAKTIKFVNFGGFNSQINFSVGKAATSDASANVITIAGTDNGGRRFDGTATISGSRITGNYVVTFSDNTTDTATFDYSK